MEEKNKDTAEHACTVNYGTGVLVLPQAAVARFGSATKKDIMALLRRLAALQGWSDSAIAATFGADDTGDATLPYWRGAGVISDDAADDGEARKPAKPQKLK